jgi:hypothetical protein
MAVLLAIVNPIAPNAADKNLAVIFVSPIPAVIPLNRPED